MIGETIAQYKILEKLGEGGMGVVYKAEDTKLNRMVALKFLLSDKMGSKKDQVRFLHEARAAAALEHPNICTVYEINEADGHTYIAMAYIDGQTIQDMIAEKKLSKKEILRLSMEIAGGIHEAHEKDIIHRDIKSANIMVNKKGQAVIMDFGLAKQQGNTMLTVEGATLGTISYMSPEQTRGDTVDQRSDIWAFGVMLYEMITGNVPFRADYDQAVIYSILHEDPEPLTNLREDISDDFQLIIDKALAKDPAQRYQNAAEILQDLENIGTAVKTEKSGLSPASATSIKSEKISFFKDIMQRRVPQITGIYFAVSLGITWFIEWLVNHYPLSPHLPEFTLAILASMIPTVLLMAYFHGKPGRDRWVHTEKIGISVNIIAAIAFLYFAFDGKDLGAATETVNVEDEKGNIISRAIPKTEFRQRLGLFYFDNQTGDSTLNWLQYGLAYLLDTDLNQDAYFSTRYEFSSDYERNGFQNGSGVPLSLKKQIAEEHHLSKFLAGSFKWENGQYIVKTKLYNTNTGKLMAENVFYEKDIFILADEITERLKSDLKIPDYHIENTEDLPISELTTNNLEAFQRYTEGEFAYMDLRDFKEGIRKYEQAVQADSGFALAWLNLHIVYILENRMDEARAAIAKVLQYKYRLSESNAYYARIEYYDLNGDMESAIGVTKNWVQLYPDNVEARDKLAAMYRLTNQLDLAIAERKHILEIEPSNYEQLQDIARYYELKGDIPQCLNYLEMYAAKFPDRYQSYVQIGDIYKTTGEFDKSIAYYKKALLLEPEKYSIINDMADIEVQSGNFDQALLMYDKALKAARGRGEKAGIYISLSNYYKLRGQVDKAIENFNLRIAEHRTHWPDMLVNQLKPLALGLYLSIGQRQEALKIIHDFEREVTFPNTSGFVAVFYINYYLDLGDSASLNQAEQKLQELKLFIDKTKSGHLVPLTNILEGNIAHANGNYQHALDCYTATLREKGIMDLGSIHRYLAKTYYKMSEFETALEHLNEAVRFEPIEPANHYQLALLYHDMEEEKKALEHLNKALSVWDKAQSDYKPAIKARGTLAEWQ
jgi:serine/threonine protein kinase/Tfp pilus assembly protein PilF